MLVDQESEDSLGGQAFWSLGGLFLVNTPEQRRLGIRDSHELAWRDWLGSAQFDREEDRRPRDWAAACVEFAAGEKRAWLRSMGHRIFPVVGWAERGDGRAEGHGNSVQALRALIEARDGQVDNPFAKDTQATFVQAHRRHRGDRFLRTATPHRFLDPANGPLIAVRLHILTRKTLGGLETDLQGRCLSVTGEPVDGLYAAGEVSGFGGGGMMGYNALEGTFLGGCLFSGRTAGRAAAAAVG